MVSESQHSGRARIDPSFHLPMAAAHPVRKGESDPQVESVKEQVRLNF